MSCLRPVLLIPFPFTLPIYFPLYSIPLFHCSLHSLLLLGTHACMFNFPPHQEEIFSQSPTKGTRGSGKCRLTNTAERGIKLHLLLKLSTFLRQTPLPSKFPDIHHIRLMTQNSLGNYIKKLAASTYLKA